MKLIAEIKNSCLCKPYKKFIVKFWVYLTLLQIQLPEASICRFELTTFDVQAQSLTTGPSKHRHT